MRAAAPPRCCLDWTDRATEPSTAVEGTARLLSGRFEDVGELNAIMEMLDT